MHWAHSCVHSVVHIYAKKPSNKPQTVLQGRACSLVSDMEMQLELECLGRDSDCTEMRQASQISPVMQVATNADQHCMLVMWNTESECSSRTVSRGGNYFHVRSLQLPSACAANLGTDSGHPIVHLKVCKSAELLVLKFAFVCQPEETQLSSQGRVHFIPPVFTADHSEKCLC